MPHAFSPFSHFLHAFEADRHGEVRVPVLSALGDTGGVAGGEKGDSVHGLQPQSREQGAADPYTRNTTPKTLRPKP
jgi:hypothetical protein